MVRCARQLGLLLLILSALGQRSQAQGLGAKSWSISPWTSVSAMAQAGDTLYIAGSFLSVGPSSGAGVVTNQIDGDEARPSPRVAGLVYCAVADGRDGWYVGGVFSGVGDAPHANLAHIRANGRVDTWNPAPDGIVRALAVSGGVLYVGGDFHQIAGQPRRSLAAFRVATDRLMRWAPDPDGNVWTIAVEQGTWPAHCAPPNERSVVFVGGEFSSIGGAERNNLAAIDGVGQATSWDPDPDYRVRALAQREDTLFVGGQFYHVGGQARQLLAAVDIVSGGLLAWNANVLRTPEDPYDGGPRVAALALNGRSLFVAGSFSSLGGQARAGLGAVDMSTGVSTTWDPRAVGWGPDYPELPYFDAMAVQDHAVLVGGEFFSLGGRDGAADGVRYAGAVDLQTGEATAWNPRPNGQVEAIAMGCGSVYIGGGFTSVWNWVPRSGLAAIDLATGSATSWAPRTDGVVRAMAINGRTAYLAGQFGSVNGQPRSNIAALDVVSGDVTPWDPHSNGRIFALAASGSTIYAGGWFSSIGGQLRNNLAALDSASGTASSWNPNPNDIVLAVAAKGTTVYAGGFFTIAGGARRGCIAALDNSTGSALAWAPSADNIVQAIAMTGERVYLGGSFTTINGQQRLGLAAIDEATGALMPWSADADQPIQALAVDSGALYAGGEFTTVAGLPQSRIAALDLQTGALLPWAVDADRVVLSMVADGRRVCAGGAFRQVGVTPAAGVAILSPVRCGGAAPRPPVDGRPPGAAFRLAQNEPNPVRAYTVVRFDLLTDATPVELAVFDLQGRRVATPLAGQRQALGAHEVAFGTAGWPPGCYLYRLDAGGVSATKKMLVVK